MNYIVRTGYVGKKCTAKVTATEGSGKGRLYTKTDQTDWTWIMLDNGEWEESEGTSGVTPLSGTSTDSCYWEVGYTTDGGLVLQASWS